MAMELSQEKKTQIAACHAKGMTVKEVAEKAKLTEAQVDVFLQSIGKKPNYSKRKGKGKRLSADKKTEVIALLKEGKGITEVSKITEVNIKTVGYYKSKLDKEKEPATAATVTDSEVKDEKENVSANSFSNNNTDTAKSQVLLKYIKCDLYGIYEKLSQAERNAWDLGEMYARVTDHLKEVVGK
jgi:hypothetical protein